MLFIKSVPNQIYNKVMLIALTNSYCNQEQIQEFGLGHFCILTLEYVALRVPGTLYNSDIRECVFPVALNSPMGRGLESTVSPSRRKHLLIFRPNSSVLEHSYVCLARISIKRQK
jgi:hypothetical protein